MTSNNSSPRYVVTLIEEVAGSLEITRHECRTIREARRAAQARIAEWAGLESFRHTLPNNITAGSVSAELVRRETRRHGSCLLAQAVSRTSAGLLDQRLAYLIAL